MVSDINISRGSSVLFHAWWRFTTQKLMTSSSDHPRLLRQTRKGCQDGEQAHAVQCDGARWHQYPQNEPLNAFAAGVH